MRFIASQLNFKEQIDPLLWISRNFIDMIKWVNPVRMVLAVPESKAPGSGR